MGIDMGAVIAQLGQQNAIESAGTLNLPNDAIQLRVNGQFNDLESLRQMPIRGMSGQQIRLGDLGVIKRDYIDPPQVKVRHNGEQVIGVGVSMAKGGDIIELGQALKVSIASIEKSLPVGVKLVHGLTQASLKVCHCRHKLQCDPSESCKDLPPL